MAVEIKVVNSKSEMLSFIFLPEKLHKDHINWVHPVYMDEWIYFNPRKNKSFEYSDTLLLLALKGKEPVGRIMGIINKRYNESHCEQNARFCHFETIDNSEVADLLLVSIEKWAKEKGMNKIIGPFGFTDKDPQGFLIEGFDQPHVIATNCNFPYMNDIVARNGYKKEIDLVVYRIEMPEKLPEYYEQIYERAARNTEIKLLDFNSRLKIKPYIKPVFSLINDTFNEIYGFSPYEEREMRDFANRYLPVIDPRFVKVIINSANEVIAFIIAMPDISEGIRKSRGRVFPFGYFQMIQSAKKTNQLNLLLGAIRQDYRNRGLDTLLGVQIINQSAKCGIRIIDSHLELETNEKVRAEMERMGGKVYKKFRIYSKLLK